MKNIETIIEELRKHPDFLTAEIFLKSDVTEYIIETVEGSEDVELEESSVQKWVKQNSQMIIENINDVLYTGYEYDNPFDKTVFSFKKQFLVESEN